MAENRPLNILMICHLEAGYPNTTFDYVESFKKYSKHNYFFYSVLSESQPPDWLDLNRFDVVALHYTVYLLFESSFSMKWRDALRSCTAYKAQFIQDEYRVIDPMASVQRDIDLDFLFTCWPEQEMNNIYTEERLPGVIKTSVLTGYVPEVFESQQPDYLKERTIDVSYRARGVGFYWLGQLYQEKSWIADKFMKHISKYPDIRVDVSTKEKDRLYGEKWINFLKNSWVTLGTESGASVVDFSGELEKKVKAYCMQTKNSDFHSIRDLFFKEIDGKYFMNQISPRIFEAIGCGCALVLYEGSYSNILEPHKHFIPLKKDFSNFDNVIEKIRDKSFLDQMRRKAYQDIILSRRYSYKNFVAHVDSVYERIAYSKKSAPKYSKVQLRAWNKKMIGESRYKDKTGQEALSLSFLIKRTRRWLRESHIGPYLRFIKHLFITPNTNIEFEIKNVLVDDRSEFLNEEIKNLRQFMG